MPQELQIIRTSEVVRLGSLGHADFAATRAALAELAGACRRRGIDQALLDLRDLHPGPDPLFTPNELAALVNTFPEAGFTHRQRLAVVYSEDPHHGARMFAFIGALRGWKVRAFGDYEAAIGWLAMTRENEQTPGRKNAAHEPPPAKTIVPAGGSDNVAPSGDKTRVRKEP
jgi:hypothetical protein